MSLEQKLADIQKSNKRKKEQEANKDKRRRLKEDNQDVQQHMERYALFSQGGYLQGDKSREKLMKDFDVPYEYLSDKSTSNFAVYKYTGDDTTEPGLVVAFRGTSKIRDLAPDLRIAADKVENSPRYRRISPVFKKLKEEFKDTSIVVTGHSLGGSMAAAIGSEYKVSSITFNPGSGRSTLEKQDVGDSLQYTTNGSGKIDPISWLSSVSSRPGEEVVTVGEKDLKSWFPKVSLKAHGLINFLPEEPTKGYWSDMEKNDEGGGTLSEIYEGILDLGIGQKLSDAAQWVKDTGEETGWKTVIGLTAAGTVKKAIDKGWITRSQAHQLLELNEMYNNTTSYGSNKAIAFLTKIYKSPQRFMSIVNDMRNGDFSAIQSATNSFRNAEVQLTGTGSTVSQLVSGAPDIQGLEDMDLSDTEWGKIAKDIDKTYGEWKSPELDWKHGDPSDLVGEGEEVGAVVRPEPPVPPAPPVRATPPPPPTVRPKGKPPPPPRSKYARITEDPKNTEFDYTRSMDGKKWDASDGIGKWRDVKPEDLPAKTRVKDILDEGFDVEGDAPPSGVELSRSERLQQLQDAWNDQDVLDPTIEIPGPEGPGTVPNILGPEVPTPNAIEDIPGLQPVELGGAGVTAAEGVEAGTMLTRAAGLLRGAGGVLAEGAGPAGAAVAIGLPIYLHEVTENRREAIAKAMDSDTRWRSDRMHFLTSAMGYDPTIDIDNFIRNHPETATVLKTPDGYYDLDAYYGKFGALDYLEWRYKNQDHLYGKGIDVRESLQRIQEISRPYSKTYVQDLREARRLEKEARSPSKIGIGDEIAGAFRTALTGDDLHAMQKAYDAKARKDYFDHQQKKINKTISDEIPLLKQVYQDNLTGESHENWQMKAPTGQLTPLEKAEKDRKSSIAHYRFLVSERERRQREAEEASYESEQEKIKKLYGLKDENMDEHPSIAKDVPVTGAPPDSRSKDKYSHGGNKPEVDKHDLTSYNSNEYGGPLADTNHKVTNVSVSHKVDKFENHDDSTVNRWQVGSNQGTEKGLPEPDNKMLHGPEYAGWSATYDIFKKTWVKKGLVQPKTDRHITNPAIGGSTQPLGGAPVDHTHTASDHPKETPAHQVPPGENHDPFQSTHGSEESFSSSNSKGISLRQIHLKSHMNNRVNQTKMTAASDVNFMKVLNAREGNW
jgi:hypothetical protein